MSASDGVRQPPVRPPSAPAVSPPQTSSTSTNPSPSNWTKDEKTKTCKCEPCGNRVRFWSYKCVECGRHICSECLCPGSEKSAWEKAVAEDHVAKGCWCGHRSNMNPAFSDWKPPPPVRTVEEYKARESKGLMASKKVARMKRSEQGGSGNTRDSDNSSPASTTGHLSSERLDQDYQNPRTITSTMTRTSERRTRVKRKVYLELESETEVHSDTEKRKSKRFKKDVRFEGTFSQTSRAKSSSPTTERSQQSKSIIAGAADLFLPAEGISDGSHLHERSTIIVGAGFIGLFVARELAIEAKLANIEHSITVVDIRGNYCELASGNCAGFLTTASMPDEWSSVANEARRCWEGLLESEEFAARLQFSSTSLSQITSSGAIHDGTPSWLLSGSSISLSEDSTALGRIDAASLAFWLYEQCELLDVNFRFNHFVSEVDVADNNTLSSLRIQSAKSPDSPSELLECHNLVLAAGSFTTGIFRSLFPKSQLVLENHVQGSDWFQTDVGKMTVKDDVGVIFPLAAESEDRLEDEIRMVSNASNNTITISGATSRIVNRDLDRSKAESPGHGKTTELKNIANKYVRSSMDKDDNAQLQILKRGRSELSVANGGCPVIDGVSTANLGLANDDGLVDKVPSGVWLCYGFGNYGTMLAPRAANMLVSKMFRSTAGLDDYVVKAPTYDQSKMAGKGKGKAKV